MIGQPDASPADMVNHAACVVACIRSLVSQDQPPGGGIQIEGDALFGLVLILDEVTDTLEAAYQKM